ncbi:MATE family efflux transporter [Aliidiomarina iranensis]|uniref:MATE family efflux transporter n=1 Tax=Aliidiomarina iranensis TaxID=1434071 RepID=A0A432W2N9_9GAMM|nr:MATE family efflux transporter [Aliidiomarina iranensis]RUO23376.1 MATE family efflux transporter [Aliidiomarina iranensis]
MARASNWFGRWHDHQRIFAIALPMMISNIAAPMLGLIDTAIIGHLPDAIYLSAVALGAMVLSFIYLLAVFLRMSTTAVIAHAFGAGDIRTQQKHFIHGLSFAIAIGLFIILLSPLLPSTLSLLFSVQGELLALTADYIQIRVWAAPAALINLVVLGVLLGRQEAKSAMLLVIFTNLVNVIADIILIIGLGMNVRGAAWASFGAEWATALIGLILVSKHLQINQFPKLKWQGLTLLARMNGDIFVRSLALQLCMVMMTGYASYYGTTVVAANAVLMQFLVLISLGLDGIAYSVEALIGQAKGQNSRAKIQRWYRLCLTWSILFAMIYSLVFWGFGTHIIAMITNIPEVITNASTYLPWLILLPLLAHWSYFFDGVFIGLGASKAMRNTMLIAALGVFLPVWAVTNWFTDLENHGLWLALSAFMAARGISQWIWLRQHPESIAPAA